MRRRGIGIGISTALMLLAAVAQGLSDEPPKTIHDESIAKTAAQRKRMVKRHMEQQGITNPRVLEAFRIVPRHLFLPRESRRLAYDDESIPIGEGQTSTPPFDMAFMTQALDPKPTDKVYEVGTGSGYQCAVLSRLVKDVYSIEIHKPLSERATKIIKELGYTNVHTRAGDGYAGWPEAAPFDAIIVTCAPQAIPPPLIAQLKDGGRLIIPIGDRFNQMVHYIVKKDGKLYDKELRPTLFVPMTGKDLEEAAKRNKAKQEAKEKADVEKDKKK